MERCCWEPRRVEALAGVDIQQARHMSDRRALRILTASGCSLAQAGRPVAVVACDARCPAAWSTAPSRTRLPPPLPALCIAPRLLLPWLAATCSAQRPPGCGVACNRETCVLALTPAAGSLWI